MFEENDRVMVYLEVRGTHRRSDVPASGTALSFTVTGIVRIVRGQDRGSLGNRRHTRHSSANRRPRQLGSVVASLTWKRNQV